MCRSLSSEVGSRSLTKSNVVASTVAKTHHRVRISTRPLDPYLLSKSKETARMEDSKFLLRSSEHRVTRSQRRSLPVPPYSSVSESLLTAILIRSRSVSPITRSSSQQKSLRSSTRLPRMMTRTVVLHPSPSIEPKRTRHGQLRLTPSFRSTMARTRPSLSRTTLMLRSSSVTSSTSLV